MPIRSACELGSGFGRMTAVLTEFAEEVVGFEREPFLIERAQALALSIDFRPVDSLDQLPAEDASFDVVLTFTVLQHLIDPVAEGAIREIGRLLRTPGHVLLCEETNPGHVYGKLDDPLGKCTIGRPVERYAELLAPLELVETFPRVIEPTYDRPDAGSYMLFRRNR